MYTIVSFDNTIILLASYVASSLTLQLQTV